MDTGGRIAIVGAGAWGLSAALAALEAQAGEITIFEREEPGSGSTALAAGLVSTQLRLESDIRLVIDTQRRLEALRAWGREEGLPSAEHAYHPVGALTTVLQRDAARLEGLAKRIARAGGTSRILGPPELEASGWGFQAPKHLVGLHTANDGYVEAGDLVDLLARRVRALGARIVTGAPVRLTIESGECVGVRTPTGTERFDRVLLAAGPWSKALLESEGFSLPVKAYRTQLAQLEFPHPADFPVFHDDEQHIYARPDGPSRILVGDGTSLVEARPETFERAPDRSFLEKVARSVARRFRSGAEARYRTAWAGLCVGTPDREPLIGPDPRIKRLVLMVGDNGFGVMRCLALGAVAAARLQGRMVPGAETYAPKRLDFARDFEIREGFQI